MPTRAKQPEPKQEGDGEQPLVTTVDTLLRLAREVADKRSKRATLPALPRAIEAAARSSSQSERVPKR